MSYRRRDEQDNSTRNTELLLLVVVLAGLGYLAYTHQEELKSFDYKSLNLESLKRLVGLGEPEKTEISKKTGVNPAPLRTHEIAPASDLATTPSTSETNSTPVPLVGRPRAVMPAHDHWTWTTTDGKTYQDVKVEKIVGDYVTILYAEGGARLPITSLPEDIQQELRVDTASSQ